MIVLSPGYKATPPHIIPLCPFASSSSEHCGGQERGLLATPYPHRNGGSVQHIRLLLPTRSTGKPIGTAKRVCKAPQRSEEFTDARIYPVHTASPDPFGSWAVYAAQHGWWRGCRSGGGCGGNQWSSHPCCWCQSPVSSRDARASGRARHPVFLSGAWNGLPMLWPEADSGRL